MQENNPPRYSQAEALQTGTLFPGLNLPFKAAFQAKLHTDNTALAELMALDFAVDELGLYLTTHPTDQEVVDLYWSYIRLANEGREKYQKLYGPLFQTDITEKDGYAWIKDPWPWDEGANN
ncbi:MAG: spore coat protein CotJB [Oscillibacter sp.]|jgi:spore coat protein JB|nr:spore coat protein CotJB [Oscillibacter sp.]